MANGAPGAVPSGSINNLNTSHSNLTPSSLRSRIQQIIINSRQPGKGFLKGHNAGVNRQNALEDLLQLEIDLDTAIQTEGVFNPQAIKSQLMEIESRMLTEDPRSIPHVNGVGRFGGSEIVGRPNPIRPLWDDDPSRPGVLGTAIMPEIQRNQFDIMRQKCNIAQNKALVKAQEDIVTDQQALIVELKNPQKTTDDIDLLIADEIAKEQEAQARSTAAATNKTALQSKVNALTGVLNDYSNLATIKSNTTTGGLLAQVETSIANKEIEIQGAGSNAHKLMFLQFQLDQLIQEKRNLESRIYQESKDILDALEKAEKALADNELTITIESGKATSAANRRQLLQTIKGHLQDPAALRDDIAAAQGVINNARNEIARLNGLIGIAEENIAQLEIAKADLDIHLQKSIEKQYKKPDKVMIETLRSDYIALQKELSDGQERAKRRAIELEGMKNQINQARQMIQGNSRLDTVGGTLGSIGGGVGSVITGITDAIGSIFGSIQGIRNTFNNARNRNNGNNGGTP